MERDLRNKDGAASIYIESGRVAVYLVDVISYKYTVRFHYERGSKRNGEYRLLLMITIPCGAPDAQRRRESVVGVPNGQTRRQ